MENNKTKKKVNIFQSNEILMLIVLAIVIAIFTGLNKNFFSITNFTNILMAASTIGLLAIGETYQRSYCFTIWSYDGIAG